MFETRRDRQNARRRAFQPSIEGQALEPRVLLATVRPVVRQGKFRFEVAAGGQALRVKDADGEFFYLVLTGGGSVRAQAAGPSRVNIILDGTTDRSELSINPYTPAPGQNSAHTFRNSLSKGNGLLLVNNIVVSTGQMNAILGYKTANLLGSIHLSGNNPVDRIAFNSIAPGASITTGNDINTLEIYRDLTISGTGTGIRAGRDLNFLHVGGNLTINNGSNLVVTRDIGLTPQAAKGTGIGGQGALIEGNVAIGAGSSLTIGRSIVNIFLVNGTTAGASRINVGNAATKANYISRGGFI